VSNAGSDAKLPQKVRNAETASWMLEYPRHAVDYKSIPKLLSYIVKPTFGISHLGRVWPSTVFKMYGKILNEYRIKLS